jgi:nucleotide-binding universal stress UspA family protein
MSFVPTKILVPVDIDPMGDRPLAERLVDDACSMAKATGAAITLLHVAMPIVSPWQPPADLISSAYRAMLDVAEARNSHCGRALTELEARATAAGVTARSLITSRSGSVPQVIVDIALEERCDLVMLTTHARRGLKRMLLGSVAERTAHLSSVPVLLLPPPSAE